MHNLTKLASVIGIASVAVAGFYFGIPTEQMLIVIGVLATTFGVAIVKPTNNDDGLHAN